MHQPNAAADESTLWKCGELSWRVRRMWAVFKQADGTGSQNATVPVAYAELVRGWYARGRRCWRDCDGPDPDRQSRRVVDAALDARNVRFPDELPYKFTTAQFRHVLVDALQW